MKKINRISELDAVRGIGILMVIYGHLYTDRIHDFIYQFHMPLFFVLAGVFFKCSDKYHWRVFIVDKLRTLVYPAIFAIVVICLVPLFYVSQLPADVGKVFLDSRLYFSNAYGEDRLSAIFSPFWFVWVLFGIELFSKFAFTNSKYKIILLCIAFHFFSYLAIAIGPVRGVRILSAFLYGFSFFAMGYLSKNLVFKLVESKTKFSIYFLFLTLFCWALFLGHLESNVDMAAQKLGVPVFSYFVAGSLIYGLFSILGFIRNLPLVGFLSSIGRSSLIIFLYHQLIHILLVKSYPDLGLELLFGIIFILSFLMYQLLQLNNMSSLMFTGRTRISVS